MSISNMFNFTRLAGKQGEVMKHWNCFSSESSREVFSFADFEEELMSKGSSTHDVKQLLDLPASCAARVQFAVQQLRIDPALLSPSQRLQIRSAALLECEAPSTRCEQARRCCCCCCNDLRQRKCSHKVLSTSLFPCKK